MGCKTGYYNGEKKIERRDINFLHLRNKGTRGRALDVKASCFIMEILSRGSKGDCKEVP